MQVKILIARISVLRMLSIIVLSLMLQISTAKAENYAVLICGERADARKQIHEQEAFWNDLFFMYETLVNNGFSHEHIYVLYGKRSDYASDNPRYQVPSDWGISQITDYAISKQNVQNIFSWLANGNDDEGIPEMTEHDALFVWWKGHGYQGGPDEEQPMYLVINQSSPEPMEIIYDTEFATYVDQIQHYRWRVFWFETCHSEGIINNLHNEKSIIHTACGYHQEALVGTFIDDDYHGEFAYAIACALHEEKPDGTSVASDSNNNGWVSMGEAFSYAFQHTDNSEPKCNDYGNHIYFFSYGHITKNIHLLLLDDMYFTGDVIVDNGVTLTINPSVTLTFAANSDDQQSGLYPDKCELIVNGTLIADGTNGQITFRSSNTTNPYDSDWVGIFLNSSGNKISNCLIRDAIYGVYHEGSSSQPLTDNQITNNIFRNVGSVGVYSYYSSGKIKNNAFYDNYSSVIYNYRSFSEIHTTPDIENNTIEAQFSTGIANYNNSNPVIKGNNIKGTSSPNGTGIRVSSSTPLILYNTIWTGMGQLGTGIAWGFSESTRGDEVRNNTIYGMDDYRIKSYYGRFHILNNIITNGNGYGIWAYGSSKPTADYNDVWLNSTNYYGISPGGHSISANPKFVNPPGGDFNLQSDSPCIDSGDPRFTDVDGSRSDMGAHPTGGIPKRRFPGFASSPPPEEFGISQNYPNPFNPQTQISYQLPKDCHVRIDIYNLLGQKVITLVDEPKRAGYHTALWRGLDSWGREVTSGVYLYKIQAGGFSQTKKMLLLR